MSFSKRSGPIWYVKSDIELITTKVWDSDLIERIDGFYFMSKNPFSKSYQWHAAVGLENTYSILSLIQKAIKEKEKAVVIDVKSGMWKERVVIWKGSLRKAERLIFKMIKDIQSQY